jgi:serine/threonine-protein kinase RsbT
MPIRSDGDILVARRKGRTLAAEVGIDSCDATFVATAISELARNILKYAGRGAVVVRAVEEGSRRGVLVEARDGGPGIADVAQALQDGFSTSGSLGLGLPGTRRLMDEFEVRSKPGRGTSVCVIKWRRTGSPEGGGGRP